MYFNILLYIIYTYNTYIGEYTFLIKLLRLYMYLQLAEDKTEYIHTK